MGLALAGCGDKEVDSGADTDTDTDTDPSSDGTGTGTTDGTDGSEGGDEPEDRDGDGFFADDDCDDSDPLTHPGATEEWNAIDDDCDGRVDADGRYTGELRLDAAAVYEGESHRYTLRCPGTIERAGPALSVDIACTPDPGDELAVLLLGETLRFTLAADDASGADWSGSLDVDGGTWTSRADATIQFVALSNPNLTLRMDSVSLDLAGEMATTLTPSG